MICGLLTIQILIVSVLLLVFVGLILQMRGVKRDPTCKQTTNERGIDHEETSTEKENGSAQAHSEYAGQRRCSRRG